MSVLEPLLLFAKLYYGQDLLIDDLLLQRLIVKRILRLHTFSEMELREYPRVRFLIIN